MAKTQRTLEDLESVVTECEIKIDKEIEDIVDRCIAESSELENFEEFKKMERDDVKDLLLKIAKNINENRSETLTNRNISMLSESKILEVAEKNGKGITAINNKFNKVVFALFAIFFLTGVVFGTQSDSWSPYIKELLDTARTANGFIKMGGNG